jgi:hypothetical protein
MSGKGHNGPRAADEQVTSRAQSPQNEWDFAEFWLDPTASPLYALLLLAKESGPCRVLDPAKGYRQVFSGASYREAKLWLLEDEYERVQGRLQLSKV